MRLKWSGDGKYLFAVLVERPWQTVVLPLSPGRALPEGFTKDFATEREIAKLPGARVIPSTDVAPGPTVDIYAFTRETVQRNLYRIPVL